MKLKPKITIADHFADLEDPRVERTRRHQLIDIITISICAVICGADTWVDIESYGRSKYEWLKKILELPNGIPSHDTIARVFSRLKPEQFQKCFLSWIQSISCFNPGEVIAIDGKTLRHSYDLGGAKKAIHMVSAWATSQRLVLGQVKVDKKSNEITAIPALLKVLELNGSIVTIDAMGCQRSIVKSIVEQGGDYVITLKNNQPSLYARVEELFEQAMRKKYSGFTHTAYSTKKESNHGRLEIRHHLMLSEIKEQIDPDNKWEKLHSIGLIESVRIVKGKTTIETRFTLVVYQIMLKSLVNQSAAIGGLKILYIGY